MVELKFNAGDEVVLRLASREVSGKILESYEKDVVLLKLESGYNIGIPREKILDYKVVKKFKAAEGEKKTPMSKKGLPTIGLIATGGTIASKLDYKTGGAAPITDVSEFRKFYPKLFEIVNVRVVVPFMKASGDMTSKEWSEIAREVKKMLDDKNIDGVIVTHGTDTLHYTSAALSFFLGKVNKPVVLTYSQRSIDRASSDAELNLICAGRFALSNCAEVVIVGHASINDDFCFAHRGTKVRKMHSSRRDAFKSINAGEIARVFPDRVEFLREYRARQGKSEGEIDDVFNEKVALVKFYPGQKPEILDFYRRGGYKGVVIEVLGLGHLPSSSAKQNWYSEIRKCVKEGMSICATAQTINGRLNPNVYFYGRELQKEGVIFLEDILSETAFVKLGWVLGHRSWRTPEKIREKMLENFVGEFSELLNE